MPIEPASFVEILKQNKGKKEKASRVIEASKSNITVLPKLIKPKDSRFSKNIDQKSEIYINRSILDSIYTSASNKKKNLDNIIKLFPDIELSIQILVSSILSPNTMTQSELLYSLDKSVGLGSAIVSELVEIIKNDIDQAYGIEDKLSQILRDILFESGSYCVAVIPETSVDAIINSDLKSISTESLKVSLRSKLNKNHNFIYTDNEETIPLIDQFVRISDNHDLLKLPKVKDKLRSKLVQEALRYNKEITLENLDVLSYDDIFRERKSNNLYKTTEIVKLPEELDRPSFGRPMVIVFPSESVIPISTLSDNSKHIGYFVLLDEEGKPLSFNNLNRYREQASYSLSDSQTLNKLSLTEKARKNILGDTDDKKDLSDLYNLYKEMMERKIYNSIKKSIYGSEIFIENREEIYSMMFFRALASQNTNVLFIPSELMVYMAFDYNEYGVGKSLLDNLTVISSLRAIMLFAKIMAYSKSAIDVTKVNVTLDENDPDMEKTIEMIQESVLRMRQNYFPLGLTNPVDLMDWIHRAGLQFTYDQVPGLPNTRLDFSNSNMDHTIPSDELEDTLRKMTIMSMGLSPETVDNGYNAEFAVSVVNNNILLTKRVMIYQDKLITFIKKFVSLLLHYDETLRTKIKEFIYKNENSLNLSADEREVFTRNREEFINEYIEKIDQALEIRLPRPETTNLSNLATEFSLYKENLEAVLDSIVSAEVLGENIVGNLNSTVDDLRNTIKHFMLRKWMSENNYYPEVFEFLRNQDDELDNVVNSLSKDTTTIITNLHKILKKVSTARLASDKELEELSNKTLEDAVKEM